MRFSLVFLFAFFVVISLSSDSEAEEEFTISVNPGWIGTYEIPGSCGERDMLDNNSNVIGTYIDCDTETGYTENITGTVRPHPDVSNSSSELYSYPWSIGGIELVGDRYGVGEQTTLSVDTFFTFNLKGSNFNNQTQYTFLYEISTASLTYWNGSSYAMSDTSYVDNSSIVFFGNSSEVNYNLSGTLADKFSTLNQSAPDLSNNCTPIYAKVVLKRLNASTNTDEIMVSYDSTPFYTDKNTYDECWDRNQERWEPYNDGFGMLPSLHFVVVLITISFVCVRKTRLA